MTVGDARLRAKQATLDLDVRRIWILFGESTIRLKSPPPALAQRKPALEGAPA